jgi:phage gp16-like protein
MNQAQLMRVINVGRGKLGWDEDLYRQTLAKFGGKPDTAGHVSLKSLSLGQMTQLLDHMRKSGFSAQPPRQPKNLKVRGRAELTRIEALLADAGRPWDYGKTLALRMYKKQALEFCSPGELAGIVAALDKDAIRRHRADLEQLFGEHWEQRASEIATVLFGFDGQHRNIGSYSEPMSKVLRWWDGKVEAYCERPVNPDNPRCCTACYQIAVAAQR